ncbi:histone deacetylase family protein [Reyranella sp.]|jgi:acetoin utilization deacetylase AcuC-like enzyme|uniref:histone deacetylase family protein n=1 Tax=Reyranella sp. TaxID=1929291 RepID=UPI002F94EC55
MKIVYSDKHAVHDPQTFFVRGVKQRSAEQPERAIRLLAAAQGAGHEVIAAKVHGMGPAAAVHTPDYLDFLQIAALEWVKLANASAEVVPNVHPARYPATYPKALAGRAGWHQVDLACPIGPGTWEAALAASEVATTAADLVLGGAREAYALCRPPGHHAYADMAGGFCFLNNTAVAAQRLRGRHPRVAILDVDVHHGNGTQGIFYERPDVLTVSIHADPAHYYPYYWGHAHEVGAGAGQGFNLNLPLPVGSGDEPWLAAGEAALTRIGQFAPEALVIALGLDASESDPLQGLKVTGAGFHSMARKIATLGLPTVLVQEGGYLSDDLGRNLVQFLSGFDAGR